MNFLYFIIFCASGFLALNYSKWITDNTGRIDLAEKYIGSGGTYTLWKIIGILLIVLSFYALINF